MNAHPAPLVDPAEVRTFIERLHEHAALATQGLRDPGMLQLSYLDADTMIPVQFAIGESAYMADEAIRQANAGFNVYVEPRTVRKVSGKDVRRKRGSLADTVAVFGLVVDDDADKGRGAEIAVPPTFSIESSPGNTHRWYSIAPAIPWERAEVLGHALKANTGGDSMTGVVTQPYRVPGTPNFPGKAKRARGRVVTPTGIISLDGPVWTPDELAAAFPYVEPPKIEAAIPSGLTGLLSLDAEALLAVPGDEVDHRFDQYARAAGAAYRDGLTPDDFEELCRRHPNGAAGKLIGTRKPGKRSGRDRLRKTIDAGWERFAAADAAREAAASKGVAPTYADNAVPVEQARAATEAAVRDWLAAADAYRVAGDEDAAPPVHALQVGTGIGKTRAAAKALAAYVKARREGGPPMKGILYLVPTLRLGDEIVQLFAEHGLVARVFRGREADDPDRPGETMCQDVEATQIAKSLGAVIQEACCEYKDDHGQLARCEHFAGCAYQAQKRESADVWVVAHQMLFQAQPALGKVELAVIDEGFWQKGLRIPKRGLTVNEIEVRMPFGQAKDDALHNDIEAFRGALARGLKRHDDRSGVGGVRRENLLDAELNGDVCTKAIKREWQLKLSEPLKLYPGMPRAQRIRAAEAAHHARHSRKFIALWNAVRELLHAKDVDVSGRVYTEHRDGEDGRVLVVKVRGVRDVATSWRVPTLLLDATMPAPEILRTFFPEVIVPAPVEAAMPHVRHRQTLGAPVAAGKLKVGEFNRNLKAIRRMILARFVELGRKPMLVVAQMEPANWLRASGLPDGIAVAHFNALAGLDVYKEVRSLIVIGRTLPGPEAVEAMAAAVTGREPCRVPQGEWYQTVGRGIRTRSGPAVWVEGDQHPDPVAEACRRQICEGELIQVVGRGRGVNRTVETPLDIDVISDVCLPLTFDEVVPWSEPGLEAEMLAEGVVLESAADMAACWPEVWPSDEAARSWRTRGGISVTAAYIDVSLIGSCHGNRFRYRPPGRGQQWRQGAFDPAVFEDATAARAWLEARLGTKLAGFEILEAEAPRPNPADRNALLDPATGRPASASALVALTACGDRPTAGAERPYTAVRLPRCADYAPELAASYHCAVDVPAPEPVPLKPVLPEVAAMRPDDEAALLARMRARPGFIPPRPAVVRDLDGQSAKLAGTLRRFLELSGRGVV